MTFGSEWSRFPMYLPFWENGHKYPIMFVIKHPSLPLQTFWIIVRFSIFLIRIKFLFRIQIDEAAVIIAKSLGPHFLIDIAGLTGPDLDVHAALERIFLELSRDAATTTERGERNLFLYLFD